MNKYILKFRTDIESIKSLIDFDTILLESTLKQLTTLQTSIKGKHTFTEGHLNKAILSINNIKESSSLKGKYQQIYNSCLVLLVAYLSSSFKDIFIDKIQESIESNSCTDKLQGRNFDFKIEDLKKYDFNLRDNIGLIITESLDISFQDMQSIGRSFKDYLNVNIPRSRRQNNIITSQALRHVIAHSDGKINKQFLNQVRDIKDRDLFLGIKEGEQINLQKKDIEFLAQEMEQYLVDLLNVINE